MSSSASLRRIAALLCAIPAVLVPAVPAVAGATPTHHPVPRQGEYRLSRRPAASRPAKRKTTCRRVKLKGRWTKRCSKPRTGRKTTGAKASVPAPLPPPTSTVSVSQTSSDLSQTLAPQPNLQFAPGTTPAGLPTIAVHDTYRFQRFTGVGAAMTDTSAWLLYNQLPAGARDTVMNDLFSSAGAHMSFLRVPIGASDFSATGVPYTYDDEPAGQSDPTLAGFSIAHDQAYILPALQAARALNPSLYLEALPWSPPAWMKANDSLTNINGAGTLLPADEPLLAQYFVRFLKAYAHAGVSVNGISPQNEPGVPTQYPGVQMNQSTEVAFVASYLRPALAAAGLSPNIFGWDLSWGALKAPADADVIAAQKGLMGLAWHCYFGNPNDMTGVHAQAPNAQQIVDECSTGHEDLLAAPELIISTLRNWATAVSTWNIALDPNGGPVQAPNSGCWYCTGLVTVDPSTGQVTLSKDFWQIAQFSHYVMPGAVRIGSNTFAYYGLGLVDNYQPVVSSGLDDVAFLNPDGSKVLYVYNTSPAPITFGVSWDGSHLADTIAPGTAATLTWR